MKKLIDNLLIISIYDSGYEFSVLNNGQCDENEENELIKAYHNKLFVEYMDYLQEKYPEYTIYICEDGDITLVQLKGVLINI